MGIRVVHVNDAPMNIRPRRRVDRHIRGRSKHFGPHYCGGGSPTCSCFGPCDAVRKTVECWKTGITKPKIVQRYGTVTRQKTCRSFQKGLPSRSKSCAGGAYENRPARPRAKVRSDLRYPARKSQSAVEAGKNCLASKDIAGTSSIGCPAFENCSPKRPGKGRRASSR